MHKGKIKKLVRERGFGFIADDDGREVFFHRSNLVGVEFDSLSGEETVEFEVEQGAKGPAAVKISIVQG